MTPTTIESKLRAAAEAPVAAAAQQAERVSQEARRLATRAGNAVEDGLYSARRTARKAQRRALDVGDDMRYRIKRQPIAAVAIAAGTGLLLGLTLVGFRRRRHAGRRDQDGQA